MLGKGLRADVDPLNWGVYNSSHVLGLSVTEGNNGEPNYVAFLLQGGLGLADRDSYLSAEPQMQTQRTSYKAYIASMLALAGFDRAAERAEAVMAFETAIAQTHATREASGNDRNADNLWTRADFARQAPGLEWSAFFDAAKLGKQNTFVVWQPSAVIGVAALVASQPLEVWKDYLRFHAVDRNADVLPRACAEKALALHAGAAARASRAQDATLSAMSEAVGRIYVERYFPPEQKARVQAIVANVIASFQRRVEAVTWMSPATKAVALAKLKSVYFGVGYPEKWQDYSDLERRPSGRGRQSSALGIHPPHGVAHGHLGRLERARRAGGRLAGHAAPAPARRRHAAARRQSRRWHGSAGSPSTLSSGCEPTSAATPVTAVGCQATNVFLPGQPCGGEEGGPVHARRPAREVGPRPQVVGVVVVGRCLARGLGLRERCFQRHYRFGPLVRTVEAGQCQQAADVLLVTGSERLHARLGADVVLAVRQAEPALQQKGDVGLLAVDARFHRQTQQMGRSVDAPVERVDIGAQAAAQEPGQRRLVPDVIDAIQQWLEWRDASGFDRGLVQIGGAEVGNFARDGSQPARRRRRPADFSDLLGGSAHRSRPRVPAFLACRNLGGPEPSCRWHRRRSRRPAGCPGRCRFRGPNVAGRAFAREAILAGHQASTAANSMAPRRMRLCDMSLTFEVRMRPLS